MLVKIGSGTRTIRASIDGLRLADMSAHVAVRLRAVDADENTMWQHSPPWLERSAVEAC